MIRQWINNFLLATLMVMLVPLIRASPFIVVSGIFAWFIIEACDSSLL